MSYAAMRSRLGTVVQTFASIDRIDGPNERANVDSNVPPTDLPGDVATFAKWGVSRIEREQRDLGGGEDIRGELFVWVWIQQQRTDLEVLVLAEEIWDQCIAGRAEDLNFDKQEVGDEAFANGFYGRRVTTEFYLIL